mmetsp:Transcript_1565/g.1699  ORF Transcript_1565/g.1699 Transcript_1565/m.1699 type:complete len:268 (+) Transcript_1565:123-926(+)|eukprot:CAMPEP_0198267210 /NCGR_PEP_ID=MMETSP1447-20131203/32013_1 /TAXON_ID=420782 /ORGANISM="Chaetoceros dichaeta, Strain CCMP1751" /LENGTH=267 /DNA_ID=CAMNT_0043957689 /DNA_START=43 /DNA_END=846 /DNA_ORIENTATION=+
MSSETYYTILGVDSTVNQGIIRKAYLKLSLKYHPDKNPQNPEDAKEQFIKIGEAYEVLSDPTKRSAYDRELRFGRPSNAGGGASFNTNDGNASSSSSAAPTQRPTKSYESYCEAFDDHVANMSEDELRAAMGTAAIVGSLVGSIIGSGLGKKIAGNSKVGQAVFEIAGSFLGSTVGSEAGVGLVQNAHMQSRDRIMYEERKRMAMERGEPLPEKPKDGWGSLRESMNMTFSNLKDIGQQMQGDSTRNNGNESNNTNGSGYGRDAGNR